jgi:TonB-linked SusC/RagA family outer membrane protein
MNKNIKFNRLITYRQVIVSLLLSSSIASYAQGSVNKLLADSTRQTIVQELFDERDASLTTSSVSALRSKDIEKNTVVSFGNTLYGRIPGLFVKQSDGEAGSDYPTLYIRGKHTFTGSNTPLVLVDGFPRDFNTLSVDEIESVSVLKDAAATALYGMDGANGVILVTTKRGVDGKTKVGFKAEYGLMAPTRLPKFYGSYDYARFYDMAETNDGKSSNTYSQDQLDSYKNRTDNILYPDVDWISEAVRNVSPIQKYVIDLRGGNKVAKFYVNLGYDSSDGLFKEIGNKTYDANNSLNRINFRSNLDVNVTNNFSMSVDLAGRLENMNSPYNGSDNIWNNLYTYHPNAAPIYAAPGVWGGTNTYRKNPLAYINDAGYKHTHRRLLQTDIKLNYDLSKFVKNLNVGVKAAFDNFYSVSNGYSKTFAVCQPLSFNAETNSYILSAPYGINSALDDFGPSEEKEIRSNSLEAYLKHSISLNNHNITSMFICHQDSYESYLSSSDLGSSPDRRVSFGAKVSYDYNKRYLLDIAASYAGGENFMRGHRFGLYPSLAGAWIVSSESFMKNLTPITFMKLRVSSGLVGNQNVGGTRFGYRNLYTSYGSGWGAGLSNGSTGSGYAEAAFGNENLTWEKAYKTDAGLDISLWNRLNLAFTYFYEYRKDILNSGSSMVPTFLGSSFGYLNYGKVASRGFEAVIDYNQKINDWEYGVALNVTNQSNKILRKKETAQLYDYLYAQGHPIDQTFGYICEGYYSEDDVKNRKVTQSFGTVIPGSLKYKDVNGDGVVDSNDRQRIGKSTDVPDWELGLNLDIKFKGFYANANIQACLGRSVNLRTSAPYATSPLYVDRNVSRWIKQPWTADVANDPVLAKTIDSPSLTIENAVNNYQTSTYFLRNGDFLRLRSLEIGYEFPKKIIKSARLQNAKVYLRGMNLLTLDHLDGFFDPEVLEGYPVLKSYNLGINLTF